MRLLLVNRHVLDEMEGGLALVTRPLQKILHWLNRNTQTGSRRNIAAHYDLGNELFRLMLDERMMYSSAIFARADMSLDEAQQYRLDRICQKLDLQPGEHLLEIGTGWGGLAIHAAQHYGCQVTSTTISKEQHALATARVEQAGLTDRITLLLEDYR
ncbi:MAG: class I SAM-dependent methyltransferase, partial [Gammaproteobacteria bacterium]